MGGLCLSGTSKPQFPSLILSDLALFCSFILSHPLYFLYFIFFSPYLLKLLSFLSPLFITTSLLLLLGLGLVHDNSAPKLSEPGPCFFLSTIFQAITHRLRPKVEYENQEFHTNLEEFEAYRIVFLFDTSTFDAIENPVEENCLQAFNDQDVANLEEKPAGEIAKVESTNLPFMEEKRLQDSLKDFENKVEEKTVDSNKVVKEHEEKSTMRSESEAKDIINTRRECNKGGGEYTEKEMLHTKPLDQNVNGNVDNGGVYTTNLESWPNLGKNIGTYGSMRKEKEWRRTLACKLFEERHNAAFEGDEGIDLLWETYESKDLSESKRMANTNTKKRNIKKSSKKDYYGDEIEDDEEEEYEMTNGQLCCLQAFKFSAGKMNLGVGRPNLVRISKALKGIGWLHHVKRHGNGKKERF